MSTPQIAITHSVLDQDAVGEQIERCYDFGSPLRCELLARGVNDVYLVCAGDERYAARVLRHDARSIEQLDYEAALTHFLRNGGIGVATPLAGRDGSYFQRLMAPEGSRYLSVFSWASGVPLGSRPDIASIEQLGRMVATMHALGKQFETRRPHRVDNSGYIQRNLPALRKIFREAPEELDFFERLIGKTCARLDALDTEAIPFGPVHSDIHSYNVMASDDGALTLIDWDLCGDDFFAQELTTFNWRNLYQDEPAELNEAYLRGYEQVRPLTDLEHDNMALFLCVHQLFVMGGIASVIGVIGRRVIGGYEHNLARYREVIEQPAREAGLM